MNKIVLKRRNLSGIFIIDKFPDETKEKPTCIEDCQTETRNVWMRSKEIDYLKGTLEILKEVKTKLLNLLNPSELRDLAMEYPPKKFDLENKYGIMGEINNQCELIIHISDTYNISIANHS